MRLGRHCSLGRNQTIDCMTDKEILSYIVGLQANQQSLVELTTAIAKSSFGAYRNQQNISSLIARMACLEHAHERVEKARLIQEVIDAGPDEVTFGKMIALLETQQEHLAASIQATRDFLDKL